MSYQAMTQTNSTLWNRMVGAVVRADPVAVASESDLLTRWPEGRRTVVGPRGVLAVGIVALALCVGSISPLLGQPILGLLLGALVAGALTAALVWFVPVGVIESRLIDSVGLGEWVSLGDNQLTVEVSAVTVRSMVSTVSGPDYCVGVQSGGLFPKEVNQFLPVVRIFDPFAGVRRPVREPELPEALDHLATAAEAICEARESRPRTTILCASGNRVISALQDRGMPANQARDALAMLRNLGVIDRKEWVKDSLALSAAGEAWVQALRTAAENDSDIPVEELVANAVRTVFREFDGPPSRVSSWDLEDWVSHVVQQFKLAVANTGLVRALWTPSGAPAR